MEMRFHYCTVNTYEGACAAPFNYSPLYLGDYLECNGFSASVEMIEIIFAYPPKGAHGDVTKKKGAFWDWYNAKLPLIRFSKGRSVYSITLQFPEHALFSGLFAQTRKWPSRKFLATATDECLDSLVCELPDPEAIYERAEEYLAVLVKKLAEAFRLFGLKAKKKSAFDSEAATGLLEKFTASFSGRDLFRMELEWMRRWQRATVERNHARREERRTAAREKWTRVRDVRFYNHFAGIDDKLLSRYGAVLCEAILLGLKKRKFACPGYSHMYVCAAESQEKALYNATRIEKWFEYGIATQPDLARLATADEQEGKKAVFSLIEAGLLDMASLDGLDVNALHDALDEVRRSL